MLSCNTLQSNDGVVKSECHRGLVFMWVHIRSNWRERFIKLAYYFITSLLDIRRKWSYDYILLMYSITTFLHYSPLIPLKRQAHSLAAKLNEALKGAPVAFEASDTISLMIFSTWRRLQHYVLKQASVSSAHLYGLFWWFWRGAATDVWWRGLAYGRRSSCRLKVGSTLWAKMSLCVPALRWLYIGTKPWKTDSDYKHTNGSGLCPVLLSMSLNS